MVILSLLPPKGEGYLWRKMCVPYEKKEKLKRPFLKTKPYSRGSLTAFKQSLFLTDSLQDKLRNLRLVVFHMLVYQVNGWKTGKKKIRWAAQFVLSMFVHCVKTHKQTKSCGAFLNWKAQLYLKEHLWTVSRIEERKRKKTSKEQRESFVKGTKQRPEAYITRDFGVKQMVVAPYRRCAVEWSDTVILLNHEHEFCLPWPNRFTTWISKLC